MIRPTGSFWRKAKFNTSTDVLLNKKGVVSFVVIFLFSLFIYTYTRVIYSPEVYAATSSTLNFQGRLLSSSGGIVADGYYNIRFKLYDGGTSGGSAGTGEANAGSLLWTDTRYDQNGATAGLDYRIRVVNGYFSVNLGDTNNGGTAFPGTINWDQELWLTMDVGGSTQTATPTYDGEMLATGSKRTKLTAVPYAFKAESANNVTTNNTSSASTSSSSISIQSGNATGVTSNSGNISLDVGTATGTTGIISIGTTNTSAITIGRSSGTQTTTIQAGTTLALNSGTSTTITSGSGNITLQAQGSSTTGVIQIGVGGAGSATPDYLALDVKSTTGDPAGGAEGYMYYNTFDNKFRCYQDSAWTDCISTATATTLQSAYDADTDGSDTIIALTATDDSLIFRNPASGGSDSTSILTIDQLNTGAKGGLSISNAGTGTALQVTATGNTSSSTSTGGAINLNNTSNTGAGLVLYSNQSTPAGRLFVVRADNVGFSQAAAYIEQGGTAAGLQIVQTNVADGGAGGSGLTISSDAGGGSTSGAHALGINLTGSGNTNASALNLTSANTAASTLQISGSETGRGTIKVSHTGTGTDGNASGISIDLQGAGTAAQGIFLDSTGGGTTGKLLNLRNNGTELLTLNSSGDLGLGVGGTPTAKLDVRGSALFKNVSDSNSAFQIQNSAGTSNLFVADTTGSRVAIGGLPTASSEMFQVWGTGYFDSSVGTSGNLNIYGLASSGAITKQQVLGSAGSVAQYDVVILFIDGSNYRAGPTTTARDSRVYGIATSAQATVGGGFNSAVSGNYQVNVDTGAVAIGDQLVTSATSGKATVDNNATTGIIGYATTSKAGGSNGTVGIMIRPVNGQSSPVFRNTTDSTTAFRIQNSNASQTLFTVDTSGNNITIGTSAGGTTSINSPNLTIGASAGSGTLTNNGATLNSTLALGDLAAGAIGTAANTVDKYTSFSISPTASGRTYTIPTPTTGSAGRVIYVSNINASNTFTIAGALFATHSSATLVYDGTSWNFAGLGGGTGLYISNQSATDQIADFRISGTGRANTSLTTPLVDSITGALSIGTSTATGITIGGTTNTTAVLLQGAAGATYTIGTSNNTGGITIGNSTATNTITIGSSAGASATQTINIGTSSTASSTTTINIGSTIAGVTTLQSQGGVKVSTLGASTANSAALCRDTSTNLLTACDASNTAGKPFLQGGNTFGALASLGTNDAFALSIETNNTVRASFSNGNTLYLGNADSSTGLAATPSAYTIQTAGSSTAATAGAALTINSGAGNTSAAGGLITMQGGNGGATGAGGGVTIQGGNGGATSGSGGALTIAGGDATGTNSNGGNITIGAGSNTGSGTAGVTIIKNDVNSTTGFQIQNASATTLLVADTTNSRIQIGSATADGTGVLLVLDTKNTSGDPTGVDGAMYYNSNQKAFRCYANSNWSNCGGIDLRTQMIEFSDFMSAGSDTMLFIGLNSTYYNVTQVNSVAGHPGILQLTSDVSATGYGTAVGQALDGILLGNNDIYRYESVQRIPTLSDATNTFTYRTGFIDSQTGTESKDGCFFRYTNATNGGRWQGVCRNNNTESTCDTGITVVANTWYRTNVSVNAAGTSADFATDGTSRCQVTTNIPTGAGRGTSYGLALTKSLGTTARTADVDYIEAFGDLATSR